MPPVEAYAAPPFVDEIALSPDAARCAFITQKGDEKQLIHFRTANPDPVVLSMGKNKVRGLFFGDNDNVVVTNSMTTVLPEYAGGKHEFYVARIVNLDTRAVTVLFAEEEGFRPMVSGEPQRVKVDGTYRVVAANVKMTGDYTYCLYSFGMTSPRGHLLDEASIDVEGWIVGPDGRPCAYSEFSDKFKTWNLRINTSPSGQYPAYNTVYQVKEPLNSPSLLGIGHDGASLVMRFDSGEMNGEYHEIAVNGTVGPSLDPDRLGSPLFHPLSLRLAGFAHHNDWFTYDYFDPLLKKLFEGLPSVLGSEYLYYVADYAEDFRKMIVYGESARDAGTYYFVDFATGDSFNLASNYPDIPEEWITKKSAVTYKAADGLTIHGYLTLPPFKTLKDLPLIVLPHGGPQSRDYIAFDWQSQVLASRGYAVLQPNFRGSSGYGRAFVDAGHGQWGRKMQTDLSDGVLWLVSQGVADPKRVAILGASYGGYAALAGATLEPGIYRCAISIAGPSDLNAMIITEAAKALNTNGSTVLYWKQFMGDPTGYNDISPARQAAQAYCPIMLIHGTDDTVVPIDQSQRMVTALKAAGKSVEFITYKGQDHWETIGSARIQMMKSALDFLNRYNPA